MLDTKSTLGWIRLSESVWEWSQCTHSVNLTRNENEKIFIQWKIEKKRDIKKFQIKKILWSRGWSEEEKYKFSSQRKRSRREEKRNLVTFVIIFVFRSVSIQSGVWDTVKRFNLHKWKSCEYLFFCDFTWKIYKRSEKISVRKLWRAHIEGSSDMSVVPRPALLSSSPTVTIIYCNDFDVRLARNLRVISYYRSPHRLGNLFCNSTLHKLTFIQDNDRHWSCDLIKIEV